MSNETITIRIDERRTMTTVRVDPLEVEIDWVRRVETRFGRPPTVTVRFVLQYEQWERARDRGCFHLDDTHEPPGFEADRPVELRARLRPALAREFPRSRNGVFDRVDDATDPVRHTEAWFATEVLQSVPMLEDLGEDAEASTGRRTRWADPRFGARGYADGTDDLTRAVTGHLEAEGWLYEVVGDDLVRFDLGIDDDRHWTVLVHVEGGVRRCTIHSGFPERVPEGGRPEAALRLAELNYGLDRGAFVLDPGDGELRFRSHVLPDHESFADALDEHVAAMSEVYDDLATLTEDESG